ncbi:MAG: TonB-dependent receptor, partial [Bacteroidaceae bacterium]|nr:TonB-dependent receptor [Bacteroidaceae bacterium]
MKTTLCLIWTMLLASIVPMQAQYVTVNGLVKNAQTNERLQGANIYLKQINKGQISDRNGHFTLSLPQNKKLEMTISFVGYQAQHIQLQLQNDTTLNIGLKQDNRLEEVNVYADQKISGIETSQMSAIEVPIEQVKKLPMLFGEVDVMKALQKLPGVQSASDGQAGIYVRGGGYDQNQITLDGATLYNAEHLKGFVSAINPDLVRSLAFYKGAFPARYGGQLSSVVDVNIKDGNMQQYHGEVSLGMLSSKIHAEGPIWKDRTSFNIGARLSYFDKIVQPMLEAVADNENAMTPYANVNYYDITAKLVHRISDKHKLSALFYTGKDVNDVSPSQDGWGTRGEEGQETKKVSQSGTENNWGNLISKIGWDYRINDAIQMNAGLNYSSYRYNLKQKDYESTEEKSKGQETWIYINDSYVDSHSGIDEMMANADFRYTANKRHLLRWGAKVSHRTLKPSVEVYEKKYSKQWIDGDYEEKTALTDTVMGGNKQKLTMAAVYAEDDFSLTQRLKANIGLRYALFAVPEKTYHSLEPRLSLRWLFRDDMALKLSYAHMAQGIHLLSSTNLVMPSDIWISIDKDLPLMKSDQWALGYNYEITKGFDLSVEGFYKQMDNLLEYREGYSLMTPTDRWAEQVVMGKGESYGVELLLQKNTGKTTGWMSYTWSKSLRLFDRPGQEVFSGKKYYAGNDRRHNLNLVVNHRFNKHWEVSAAWNYQTGRRGTLSTTTFFGSGPSEFLKVYLLENDLKSGLTVIHFLPILSSYKVRN